MKILVTLLALAMLATAGCQSPCQTCEVEEVVEEPCETCPDGGVRVPSGYKAVKW